MTFKTVSQMFLLTNYQVAGRRLSTVGIRKKRAGHKQ